MDKLAAVRFGAPIATMFAIAIWTIHALPSGPQVAIHWGPDGHPDAWVGQGAGMLVMPLVACVLWFLLTVYPQGFWSSTKPIPPADLRRRMFSRVLLIQLAVQVFLAIRYLG
jgi:uncharacterized membrane protein